MNPRLPPLSANACEGGVHARLNYRPLLSFESKTIFNSIEWLPSRRKNFVLFVLALNWIWACRNAVFFLLFALFALVCECTAVPGAVLFPLFDFFGFLSFYSKGSPFTTTLNPQLAHTKNRSLFHAR